MRKILLFTVVAATLTGCTVDTDVKAASPLAAAPSTSIDTAAPEPTPSEYMAETDDWEVGLKVTEKQCFGSAGCNVTVAPSLNWVAHMARPDHGTVSITFQVAGDESGPVTRTIEADLATGDYRTREIYLSTKSTGVKPTAIITTVEASN